MKRKHYVAVIAVLMALVAAPAVADHIIEPTSPITEYTLEVYAYPNFATRLTACDGTEVLFNMDGTVADDARFETFTDHPTRGVGNPSEHWDETLTLFVVENFGNPRREVEHYQWRVSWKHSNIKPHAHGGVGDNGPESSQNSQRLDIYPPGTILRLRGDLTTLESGQQFTAQCTFLVGDPVSNQAVEQLRR